MLKFEPFKTQLSNAIAYIQVQQSKGNDFSIVIKTKEQIKHELGKVKPELVKYATKIHSLVTQNGYKLD